MDEAELAAATGTSDVTAQRDAAMRMHEVQFHRANRLESERTYLLARLAEIRLEMDRYRALRPEERPGAPVLRNIGAIIDSVDLT